MTTKKKTEAYDEAPGVDVADILRERRLDALHEAMDGQAENTRVSMDRVDRRKHPDIVELD